MSSIFACYGFKIYFRGRQIREDCLPPDDLIENFIERFTNGLAHSGWSWENDDFEKHHCHMEYSIETCILLGYPLTDSVQQSTEW